MATATGDKPGSSTGACARGAGETGAGGYVLYLLYHGRRMRKNASPVAGSVI